MRVTASVGVKAELTKENQREFVEFFLEKIEEDGDVLEFIPESWCQSRGGNDAKPIYTVAHKDGKRVMIVWPIKDEGGDCLHLTWQHECPWLDGLHEHGPGDFGPNEEFYP